MYFVYGCPKVLTLRPEPKPGEETIQAIAFNPSGSLLAIASTSRVCVWSGGKDHVPLGSIELQLRGLTGTSLLWKRESSVLCVVSAAGKLVTVSVKKKPGARPASEGFTVPDWLEPQVRHVDKIEKRFRALWWDQRRSERGSIRTQFILKSNQSDLLFCSSSIMLLCIVRVSLAAVYS